MRKLLISAMIVLCTAVTAHSGTWAVAKNKAGGFIGLTDDDCTIGPKVGKLMFSMMPGGQSLYGCWASEKDDDFIHVRYADGTFYTYPLDIFELTDYAKQRYDKRSL